MDTRGDRTQIGLSEQGRHDRDAIKDVLDLGEGQDAYRLAVAVALSKRLAPADENARRTNAYGTSSLDERGELRAAILELRDDHSGRPYALMERLAEAGLRDMAAHLDSGLPLRQYLSDLVPTPTVASAIASEVR